MTNAARKTEDISTPFQLRGSSFNVLVLKIQDPNDPSLFPQLSIKTRQAPNFFHQAAIVIDVEDVSADLGVSELASFVARMKQCHLVPVGIQGARHATQKAALAIGLAIMIAGRPVKEADSPATTTASKDAPAAPPPVHVGPTNSSLVITEPVRSGQQVYAAKGDLIVMAPVSPGAELLADGHIHVYGPLRGRALAGLGGDTSARIFCHSLEAELVSVAGLYRISEDINKDLWKKSVQIYLDGGYLRITPLS